MSLNLREARRQFVTITRRNDLLLNGDIVANVDNGANVYINKAQKYLDLRVDHPFSLSREVLQLPAGTVYVHTERLLSVESLRGITSTGAVQPRDWKDLTRFYVPYKEFRELTPALISSWPSGPLEGWTVQPIIAAPKTSRTGLFTGALDQPADLSFVSRLDEHMNNGDFTTPQTTVTTNSQPWAGVGSNVNWNLTGGNASLSGSTSGLTEFGIWQRRDQMLVRVKENTKYRIRASVTLAGGAKSGNLGLSLFFMGVEIFSGGDTNMVHTLDITVTTPATINGNTNPDTLAHNDSIAIFWMNPLNPVTTFTIDNVSVVELPPAILPWEENCLFFYPKPDVEYTIEITGHFLSRALSFDEDYSYWTANYMELLVSKAAQMYYEELGNAARVEHFKLICEDWLNAIDNQQVEFELTGTELEMER